MNAKTLLPAMVFLFLLSIISFGQSKATKNTATSNCHNAAKTVVWQSLMRKSNIDDLGKCSDVLRTKTLNLGNRKGFTVRYRAGLCGVTGNCSTWILLKNRNRLKIILSLEALDKIEMKQASNKTQPLLMFRYHMSSSEYYLSTFRFTGRSLDFIRCQLETYDIDRKRHLSNASRVYCLE